MEHYTAIIHVVGLVSTSGTENESENKIKIQCVRTLIANMYTELTIWQTVRILHFIKTAKASQEMSNSSGVLKMSKRYQRLRS